VTVHSVLISKSSCASWLQMTFYCTATTQIEVDKFSNISVPSYHILPAKYRVGKTLFSSLFLVTSKIRHWNVFSLLTGVLKVLGFSYFITLWLLWNFSCFYSPHLQEKPLSLRTTCRTVRSSFNNKPIIRDRTIRYEGRRTEVFSAARPR
jgi:hypothetical protein